MADTKHKPAIKSSGKDQAQGNKAKAAPSIAAKPAAKPAQKPNKR